MIHCREGHVKIDGKVNIICGELGVIFNNLIKELGEIETIDMINIALNTVIGENKKEDRKQQIKENKELKKILKRNLPKEISDILCNLL